MASKDDKVFGLIKVECHSVQVYCIFQLTSERVSGIFFSMEKGLGAVLSKNDKVFGFFKAVPPPIIITQYLTEEEYVAACRTEDRSSTKLSATQWHSKMTKFLVSSRLCHRLLSSHSISQRRNM